MDNILDIAEVAARTGLTSRALRFYEARGLVKPLRTGGGRRVFGPGELARLNAIVALKRAGFSLSAIGAMLGGKRVDLGRLVDAQLAEIDARATELTEARALLRTVKSRIDRREPIDVATLCSLIRSGDTIMEHENWKQVADRYFSPEEQARWAGAMKDVPAGFDHDAYNRQWAELGTRIAGKLPLDPASAEAQALYDEWQALLAPFNAVATPEMKAGATKLYERMGEWQGDQKPPFSMEVWNFIQTVGKARKA